MSMHIYIEVISLYMFKHYIPTPDYYQYFNYYAASLLSKRMDTLLGQFLRKASMTEDIAQCERFLPGKRRRLSFWASKHQEEVKMFARIFRCM